MISKELCNSIYDFIIHAYSSSSSIFDKLCFEILSN